MWKTHLWNLLCKSANNTLSIGGTTALGIFCSVAAILIAYLAAVLYEWNRIGRTRIAFKGALKSWPSCLMALIGLALAWSGLFIWSVITIIYSDHLSLAANVVDARKQTAIVSAERDQWMGKFESLKAVPPKEIIRTTETEKKCWLSNHAGLATAKTGNVTANAAIIRCNYRIEAPFTVRIRFNADFEPGNISTPDASAQFGGGLSAQGRMLIGQVDGPALAPNQLVIVTVYGRNGQYPIAIDAGIAPSQ